MAPQDLPPPERPQVTAGDEVYFKQDMPERCWVDGSWQTGVIAQTGDTGFFTRVYQKECLNRIEVMVGERTMDTLLIHIGSVLEPSGVALDTTNDSHGDVALDTIAGGVKPTVARKKKKHYDLHEMSFFMQFRSGFQERSLFDVCKLARERFGATFNSAFNTDRAKWFPEAIKKKEAAERRKVTQAEKKRMKKLLKSKDKTHAPSMAEKEAALKEADVFSNRNGRRVLPVTMVMSMAMMLYGQYLSGVPINAAIALPMMSGHIRAHDCGHLLHSQQTPVPLMSSMRLSDISHEHGRIFFTKRLVNEFYVALGLSMRRGTCCFSKSAKPAEVESLKELMMHRLLYLQVEKDVKRSMVFQIDETGVSLLPFSKRGRAQQGMSEVRFLGFDEPR